MNPLKHVAIIMDGNGRWGLQKKNNRNFKIKKNREVVKGIDDNVKQRTQATARRKSMVFGVINDVSKKNTTSNALRCRPATASLAESTNACSSTFRPITCTSSLVTSVASKHSAGSRHT